MHKSFIVILLLFLLTNLAKSQTDSIPIFVEHNSLLSDTTQVEIISYRIPYKNLLFIKTDAVYSTSFTITMEFYQSDEFVQREIRRPEFSTNSYEETLSGEKYYQDAINFNLKPGDYKLNTIVSLGETDIEYKIPEQKIKIDTLRNSKLFDPIIVANQIRPDNNNQFILTNFGNTIPFSPQRYDLIIGIVDPSIHKAHVTIKQFNKEVYTNLLTAFSSGNIHIEKDKDNIAVVLKDSSNMNYFHVSGFSQLLNEGASEIIIKSDNTEIKFQLSTVWINKPEILNNPEYSIKLLEYIENDNVVGKLLSSSEEDYYKILSQYWIEKYPADGMKFNYAMKEYYTRADYAIKNFSSLNTLDGAERDRGRIYITYGPPTSIERNYTEMNEIVENWTYDKAGRVFVFKDTNGTGKFDLVK